MRKSWWACVLQGKMLLHTDLSSRLWWLFVGRDLFFPGLLLGKSRVYLIQEVSHFYCYKVTLKKRFSCVIQLLLVTEIMSNSICISLESSWAIFLFITMKRDRLPHVGNPRAAIKLLWNISVHPCGHSERRWIPNILGQAGAVHTTALLLCQIPLQHSRGPLQCSLRSSSKCCSLCCCLWLNWPILQQIRAQGEVNSSRSVKRQVGASVNSVLGKAS